MRALEAAAERQHATEAAAAAPQAVNAKSRPNARRPAQGTGSKPQREPSPQMDTMSESTSRRTITLARNRGGDERAPITTKLEEDASEETQHPLQCNECKQCGDSDASSQTLQGRVDPGDGQWYCYGCWENYNRSHRGSGEKVSDTDPAAEQALAGINPELISDKLLEKTSFYAAELARYIDNLPSDTWERDKASARRLALQAFRKQHTAEYFLRKASADAVVAAVAADGQRGQASAAAAAPERKRHKQAPAASGAAAAAAPPPKRPRKTTAPDGPCDASLAAGMAAVAAERAATRGSTRRRGNAGQLDPKPQRALQLPMEEGEGEPAERAAAAAPAAEAAEKVPEQAAAKARKRERTQRPPGRAATRRVTRSRANAEQEDTEDDVLLARAIQEYLQHVVNTEDEDMARAIQESEADAAARAREREQLVARAGSAGYVFEDVDDTGDCMFDAIAKQESRVSGTQVSMSDVRAQVATYLRDNAAEYRGYVITEGPEDKVKSFEEYCNRVERTAEGETKLWGDNLTLETVQ